MRWWLIALAPWPPRRLFRQPDVSPRQPQPSVDVERTADSRFPLTVFIAVGGLMAALLAGRVELAVLTVPWFVVLLMAISMSRRPTTTLAVGLGEPRAHSGDTVTVSYELTVRGIVSPATIELGRPSDLDPSIGWPDPPAQVVTPGATAHFEVPVSFADWGTWDVGQVRVEITERHGLFRWSSVVRDSALIRIHPDELQVRRLLAPTRMHRLSGAHQSPLRERGAEFASLRHHQPGDTMRNVNWRATARSDKLWVSDRHPDRATDVVVLLDTFGGTDQSSKASRHVLTTGVRVAVAVAARYLASTDRVGLVEIGGVVRWVAPSTGRRQLYRLIDSVLAIQPHFSYTLVDDRFIEVVEVLSGRGYDIAVVALDHIGWNQIGGRGPVGSGGGQPATGPDDRPDAGQAGRTTRSLAEQLWMAERDLVRDRLTGRGVAVARWDEGLGISAAGLQSVLDDLTRRRQLMGLRGRRPPVGAGGG